MRFVLLSILFFASCAKVKEAPVDEFYIPVIEYDSCKRTDGELCVEYHLKGVCAKYIVKDKEKLLFDGPYDIPLKPQGPCDRMVGVKRQDWNTLKNWIRDQIDESKKKTIPIEP